MFPPCRAIGRCGFINFLKNSLFRDYFRLRLLEVDPELVENTAIAANTDNLPCSPSAFQRINCTSTSNLTGIAPPTGGTHVDGRMIRVYNVGTANLTLVHNATSTAANRFFNSTLANIILAQHDYAELIYDITDNGSIGPGWRVA